MIKSLAAGAALLSLFSIACAQTLPARPSDQLPGLPGTNTPPGLPGFPAPVGPVTAEPLVLDTLKMLHDRKATLHDFTAKIDYNVEDPRTGSTGKRGTVTYILDPARNSIFSADFTVNTVEGKPKLSYHSQIIFDGLDLTVKDWGNNNTTKTFVRTRLLPPDAHPGDAVTLTGPLTLPIGLDVNDVLRTFFVTAEPSDKPDTTTLKLIPRPGTKFNYKQLVVTVDKKLELPTTISQTAPDDTISTITLTDPQINTGTAKMLDPSTPATDGWSPKVGNGSPAPINSVARTPTSPF